MSKLSQFVVNCCAVILLTGCAQQKIDLATIKQPPRPAQLDLLDSWVGKWENTGEMTACDGQVIHSTGTHEISWDLDKRVLLERVSEDLGLLGKVTSLSIYSYDPREREFDYRMYTSNGVTSHGDMKYNEMTKTWKLEVKGHSPMAGATRGEATFKMTDGNTIEWTWKEWDALKLGKMFDGHGTVKRK